MHRISSIRIADFKELNPHNFCSAIQVQNFSSSRTNSDYDNRRARLGFSCQSVTHSALFDAASFSPQGLWMTSTTKAIQLRLALCRVIILTVSSPRALQNLHKRHPSPDVLPQLLYS